MNEAEAMPYFNVEESDSELSIAWSQRNQMGYSLLAPLLIMIFLTLVCSGGIRAAIQEPDFDDYPMLIAFCGLWLFFVVPCLSGFFAKYLIRLNRAGLMQDKRLDIPLDRILSFGLDIERRGNRICFTAVVHILYDEESRTIIVEYNNKRNISVEDDEYRSFSLPLVYDTERRPIDELITKLNELLAKLKNNESFCVK